MKTRSLSSQIFLGIALVVLVTVTLIGAVSGYLFFKHRRADYDNKALAIAETLSNACADLLLNRDPATIQSTINQYLKIDGVAYIFVRDSEGTVVCHTFVPYLPNEVFTIAQDSSETTVSQLKIFGKDAIDVSAPILKGQLGFVHVGMDQGLIRSHVWNSLRQMAAVVGLCLVSAMLLAWGLTRQVSRPVSDLAAKARAIGQTVHLQRSESSKFLRKHSQEIIPLHQRADEIGELSRAMSFMVDQMLRRESELRKSEEHARIGELNYRTLLDNVTDIIIKLNASGTVTYVSPSLTPVLHWSPSEWIGHPLQQCLPGEYGQEAAAWLARELQAQKSRGWAELHVANKSGTAMVLEVLCSKLSDEGIVIGAILHWRDVTAIRGAADLEKQRLAAENAHRIVEAAYREAETLLSSIASILIGVDESGKITRWNATAEQVFHLPVQSALGTQLKNCGVQWQDGALHAALEGIHTTRTPLRLDDVLFRRPDGSLGHLGVTINPIWREQNKFLGHLILGADVTENKRMEDQLRQAQKLEAIGQLAAGIAHEINTPIQFIGDNTAFVGQAFADSQTVLDKAQALVEAARTGALAPELVVEAQQAVDAADLDYLREEVPKAIQQSIDGVRRVSEIVRAMKGFSHMGDSEKAAADLNEAIKNTLIVARNEWKYVAEAVTELDEDLPLVPCFIGEINQVLLNLIVNATHAIAEHTAKNPGHKGIITIGSRKLQREAEIFVRDTGAGIPEAIRARVFEPFFTTKQVGKGTGQGLAIAHSVITKKHGGTLRLESDLGKGTTFFITLPLEPAQACAGQSA